MSDLKPVWFKTASNMLSTTIPASSGPSTISVTRNDVLELLAYIDAPASCYEAVREDGHVVQPGEVISVTGEEGEERWLYVLATRPTTRGKSGKVLVTLEGRSYNQELYAHIFNLKVRRIHEEGS